MCVPNHTSSSDCAALVSMVGNTSSTIKSYYSQWAY